jgi:hypothetical protein
MNKIKLLSNLYEIYLSGNNSNSINVYSIEIFPTQYQSEINLIYEQLKPELNRYYKPHIFIGGKIFCPLSTILESWKYSLIYNNEKVDMLIKREAYNLNHVNPNIVISIIEKIFFYILNLNVNITLNVFKYDGTNFFLNIPENIIENNTNNKYYLFIGYNLKILFIKQKFYLLINTLKKFVSSKNLYYEIKNIQIKNLNLSQDELLSLLNGIFSQKIVLFKFGQLTEYKILEIKSAKSIEDSFIPVQNYFGAFNYMQLNQFSIKFSYNFQFQNQPKIKVIPLNNKTIKPLYIPSELLYIENENLIKNPYNLNIEQEQNIIRKFSNFLYENKRRNELLTSPNDIMNQWGLGIGYLENIEGKIFNNPQIQFLEEQKNVVYERIKNRKIILPINFNKNDWIFIIHKKNYCNFEKIFQRFKIASETLGINFEQPSNFIIVNGLNDNKIYEEIEIIEINSENKIIFICLEFSKYPKLERLLSNLYISKGFMFQMFDIQNFQEFPQIYYENILCRIIVKNGGEIFHVKIGNTFLNNENFIMAIGIFISNNLYRRTIISSSTYDKNFCHYYTEFKDILAEDDISLLLINLINKAILKYNKKNNNDPNIIILYFNCLNEKDFLEIKKYLNDIQNMLNNKIKLCFITVHKNTNFQFFRSTKNKIKNPKIGTVIPGFLTNNKNTFYLQSKYTKEKKLNITEYRCLINNTDIELEKIELFTFKLCFFYWFKNRGINIPSPLKYAQVCFYFIYSNQIHYVNEKLINYPYFC